MPAESPPTSEARGSVADTLFELLNEHGISFCLLRGLDQLHEAGESHEIDLLVPPRDLARFRALVTSAGYEHMPSWGSAPHVFFVKRDSTLGTWIKLDVVTDLRYGRLRVLQAGNPLEYLARRCRDRSAHTLAPEDEFVHLILHGVLDKGSVEPRYQRRLQQLWPAALAAPGFAGTFDRLFAPALALAEVAAAVDTCDWGWIGARRRPLERQLLRRQQRAAAGRFAVSWTARRLRPLQKLQHGRGLVVALLGPDGAGKTSVALALSRSAPLAVRRVYMGYGSCDTEQGSWLSRGLWRLASAVPPARPHFIRRIRLCLRWIARVVLQVGRSVVVRARRATGQVVLLDRHVYDFWLQVGGQQQDQSPARRAIRWCLTAMSPAPDLVVVLDAPAEVLWQRKAEWPVEVLRERRASYRELADRVPHGVMVDAGRDFAQVSGAVADEVWKRRTTMHGRGDPALERARVESKAVAKQQIRGSSLLLSGRIVAIGVAAIAQVLLIRYLAPPDFGRWMYVLSAVAVLKSVAALGVDRSVTRFVAIYYERGDHARLFGVMLLTIAAVLGTGGLMIAAVHAFPDQVMRLTQDQSEPLRLLLILIFLVPLEAMDSLLLGLFACFGNARAIFFRRHIVAPGLRLATVLIVVLSHASVIALAYGYVLSALAGLLFYGRLLWRVCRDAGVFVPWARVVVPAREVFTFTFPMLVSDVALALTYGAGVFALGFYGDMASVAIFAAALPLAVLNQSVMRSFSLLYTSSASKLLAKGDLEGINHLYWQTAVWLAVLTFPVFALTFSAAGALTLFLYGSQYAAAGPILALLALGEYVNVALGFNGTTLRVLNRAGYLTAISTGTAAVTIALVFWAAPRYGALGVAVATSASMVLHNALKQFGLRLATGVTLFDRRYAGFYAALVATSAGLLFVNALLHSHPIVVLVLTGAVSVAMLFLSKRVLKIGDVFPEIKRVPFLRALLA